MYVYFHIKCDISFYFKSLTSHHFLCSFINTISTSTHLPGHGLLKWPEGNEFDTLVAFPGQAKPDDSEVYWLPNLCCLMSPKPVSDRRLTSEVLLFLLQLHTSHAHLTDMCTYTQRTMHTLLINRIGEFYFHSVFYFEIFALWIFIISHCSNKCNIILIFSEHKVFHLY